jgi:hypothetical protein
MNINGIVDFLHHFFYKLFEALPFIGWWGNYISFIVMGGFFVYWLSVLAKDAKTEKLEK